MTDATDAPDPTPITNADRLLSVQRIDTEADQLVSRRERLAEQLGTPEALRDHSVSLNKLGELHDLVESAAESGD